MSENKINPTSEKPSSSGNIWGWKFSFISLGIILFMLALAAFRHWQLNIPVNLENVQVQDSTKMENEKMNNEKNDTILPKHNNTITQ